MLDRLQDCLTGRESTEYILPFFWQHGEEHDILAEEIDAMERANIRQFCVESRTHQEFGKEKWWEDFGFILAEAKRRDMRVWLLDDKRFPTGYANGYVSEHPELRKTLLRMEWRDFAGPRDSATIIALPIGGEESFVSISAFRREKNGNEFLGEPVDLLPLLKDGLIRWSIPEGMWRVFWCIRTRRPKSDAEWIDVLRRDSCEAMIHAVYQPHYDHFKEYFGSTFAGFFSDEPRFGNEGGSYLSKLGKEDMPLPWRDDLPELIAPGAGMTPEKVRVYLPVLFHPYQGIERNAIRCHYMDVITKLYRDNFVKLLGEWSRAHGVMYIGHVIEDMNTHQRLGYGAGHFFRSLEYEDMSGMDIVLQQIIPGVMDVDHAAPCCGKVYDPEFFNYFLAKLPVSQAHTTERMHGRAMCEIYGAFGWAEGVPFMKQLTDHMLVNGINYFVPHAFSPKYPDRDCPPHFYARGMFTQSEAFAQLMLYMRRSAHLISGGIRRAPAAVLYNAEAEWADGANLLPQKIGKALLSAQIDYDVLSEDTLDRSVVENGELCVLRQRYRVLLVPASEYLTRAMIETVGRIVSSGVPVYVVGGRAPEACEDRTKLKGCIPVSLDSLPAQLTVCGIRDISVSPAASLLFAYRMTHGDRDVFLFCSEDMYHETRTTVTLPDSVTFRFYDPWTNRLFTPRQEGNKVDLYLPRSGAIFLIADDTAAPAYDYAEAPLRAVVPENVRVSIRSAKDANFTPIAAAVGDDVTALPGLDRFSGAIRYECTLTLTGDETALSLGEIGEVAAVTLNGKDLGWFPCEPYCVPIADAIRPGSNDLVVEVRNSIAYRERDNFSTYVSLPRSGWLGPCGVR